MKTYKEHQEYRRRARHLSSPASKEQVYNDAVNTTIAEVSQAIGMTEASLKSMIGWKDGKA